MQDKTLLEHWAIAKDIAQRRAERGKPEFPTGIDFVDDATDGIHRGEVWVIAGKTSSGKTSCALQIARSLALNPQNSILFLTLEMKGWELVSRMFCEMMEVNSYDFKRGVFPPDYPQKEQDFRNFLIKADFEIFEYGFLFQEIEKILATSYKEKKPDIIFIDFLQMIEWKQYKDQRLALMEYIRKLKELAKTLDVAIVVISQLRRLPSGADYNRPPDTSDLMGSGSIEQTADCVLLIYREITKTTTKYFINIAKNRHGESSICKEVLFQGWFYKFKEILAGQCGLVYPEKGVIDRISDKDDLDQQTQFIIDSFQ